MSTNYKFYVNGGWKESYKISFIGIKGLGMGTQGVRRSIESMTREQITVININ